MKSDNYYTDEELREMVKCIPVYPYVLEDEDVWDDDIHPYLCFRSKEFKAWWDALHSELEILDFYPFSNGLISEEEYDFDSGKRLNGSKLRLFYLEHCRDSVQGWP